MHEHVDVNRMLIRVREPLPEICIPRQAIAYLPRALKTTFATESANRSLAGTLCFPLLTLTASTLHGFGLFSQRSSGVACGIGVARVLLTDWRQGLSMRWELQMLSCGRRCLCRGQIRI